MVYFPEQDGALEDATATSPYLNRPLRTEAEVIADRRARETRETFAAPRGFAEAIGSAVAFYAAVGTVAVWWFG